MAIASRVVRHMPDDLFVRLMAWQYRYFERELARIDEYVPVDRGAVDIGVWWGPWTYWLARRVPTVDSFEPNPDLVARLEPVLPGRVTLHPVALGDRSGDAQLWIPPGGMGTEGRATVESEWRTDTAGRLETVAMQRLDDVELPDIGFIKIDVEGHELEVLRGAAVLLRTQRPNLMIEIEEREHSEGHFDSIIAFLAELGYHGSFLSGRRWLPIEAFDRAAARDLTAKVSTHGYATNFLLYARRHIHNFLFRPL